MLVAPSEFLGNQRRQTQTTAELAWEAPEHTRIFVYAAGFDHALRTIDTAMFQ